MTCCMQFAIITNQTITKRLFIPILFHIYEKVNQTFKPCPFCRLPCEAFSFLVLYSLSSVCLVVQLSAVS